MDNNNTTNSVDVEQRSFKEYINLLRNNLIPFLIVLIISIAVSIAYALNTVDIYKSTTSLKIAKPKGNILESALLPEVSDFANDRFIANEIEILKSYSIREKIAISLVDSFKTAKNKSNYYLLLDKKLKKQKNINKPLSPQDIIKALEKTEISQKRGLDIIEISVESPSKMEAALIANVYADEYRHLNLEINRDQLTSVKNFLREQKSEKQQELNVAEDKLKNYQEQGGIIALDEQATNLIDQLSDFEAKRNAAQIELAASNQVLHQLKSELQKQNPRINDFLKNFANEAYVKALQEQLAKQELNRDLALSSKDPNINNSKVVKDYEQKINELHTKLNEKIEVVKAGIFASSPEEIKGLTKQVIAEEIKNQSLGIQVKELSGIVRTYDSRFNELPKTFIEFAKFQRNREALEKLFVLVEEKYQEALINEQSQQGNVLVIDKARIANLPSKPNRMLIILVGFVLGGVMGIGYIVIKNYFDNTVKTPEDIQKRGINVLTWIPIIESSNNSGLRNENEFIVSKRPDSIPSEAFRALRTRVQFTNLDDVSLRCLLTTSSAPQEGKTTVSINLAASFAQSNKRVLVVDCDLRKPRVHSFFKTKRLPGLIEYLYNQATLEEVIRSSEVPNLFYLPAGTIPPNPSEVLESNSFKSVIEDLKSKYDLVVLDSPPIIAVTDAEILSNLVDASLLVVSAENTEIELLDKSVEMLRNGSSKFLGTVLNNFSYKSGYGSYYKYYYYYSRPESKKGNSVTTLD